MSFAFRVALIPIPLSRAGLGSEKRFLWIADLSRPHVLLAVVASALVAGSAALAVQTGEGAQVATMFRISIVLAAAMTLVMLLSSAAAIAVSVPGGAVGKPKGPQLEFSLGD